jgi:hypothetical protein
MGPIGLLWLHPQFDLFIDDDDLNVSVSIGMMMIMSMG